MTINELVSDGVILQGLCLVTHEEIGEDGTSTETVLFDGIDTATGGVRTIDLYFGGNPEWADRPIRYIYPLPAGEGRNRHMLPILAVEVE